MMMQTEATAALAALEQKYDHSVADRVKLYRQLCELEAELAEAKQEQDETLRIAAACSEYRPMYEQAKRERDEAQRKAANFLAQLSDMDLLRADAEAALAEAKEEIKRLGQQMYYECVPKGEANKRIAEEQEISLRWAREANARAETAEADNARLREALTETKKCVDCGSTTAEILREGK